MTPTRLSTEDRVLFAQTLKLLGKDRSDEALQTLIDGVRSIPSVERSCALGALLIQLGRPTDARLVFRAAAESYPQDYQPWYGIARGYLQIGLIQEADSAVLKAMRLAPENSELLGLAATVKVLKRDYENAECLAEKALAGTPGQLQAAAALCEVFFGTGREQQANELTKKCIQHHPIQSINHPGKSVPKVLLLQGIGVGSLGLSATGTVNEIDGHTNLASVIAGDSLELIKVTVDALPKDIQLPCADIAVNVMAEPIVLNDALTCASKLLAGKLVTVINAPEKVAGLNRALVAEKLREIPGLAVPVCYFVEGEGPEHRLAKALQLAKDGKLKFPLIVRPAGAHNGYYHLVTSPNEFVEQHFVSRVNAVYVTEFVDARLPDGLWRKTRGVVIGGIPMIEHHYISTHHCVNLSSSKAFALSHPWAEIESQKVIAEQCAKTLTILAEIARILELDFVAIDFVKCAKGRIVFFEASPCVRWTLASDLPVEGEYLREVIGDIRRLFMSLIANG